MLVIVIVAILAAIVIVAVNPARQISQTNNTQRSSDVSAILNAVHQYAIDNRGAFPGDIDGTVRIIGDAGAEADICADLVPTYIAEMPFDPPDNTAEYTDCNTYDTGYDIVQDATSGRITVSAPSAELGETVIITK